MRFLQPTASNFKVENSYPVKVKDCSTLQIDTIFFSKTLVIYVRLHGVVCQRTILFKAKTTCTCFEDGDERNWLTALYVYSGSLL